MQSGTFGNYCKRTLFCLFFFLADILHKDCMLYIGERLHEDKIRCLMDCGNRPRLYTSVILRDAGG